jgi:hypothetical protein
MKRLLAALAIFVISSLSFAGDYRVNGVSGCGTSPCVQNGNLTDSVLLHWSLEEVAAPSRSVTNYLGFPLSWDNTVTTTGKIGNGVDTSNSGAIQITPVVPSVYFGDAISINQWVTQETGVTSRGLIYAGGSSVWSEVWVQVVASSGAAVGPLEIGMTNTDNGAGCVWTFATTPSAATWYMVTAVIDKSKSCTNGLIKGYHNGVLDGSITFGPVGTFDSLLLDLIYLGSGNIADGWSRKIDEVSYFNKALSPTEISCLYKSGSGRAWPWQGC